MVAGIIGAVGNNNAFGVGINWQVQLMNLKVLRNSGMEEAVVPITKGDSLRGRQRRSHY